MNRSSGFTLIELVITVAIVAILAAIAIPMYAHLITKAQEGTVKGQLATVRSALSVYYGDNEGVYPDGLNTGLVAGTKYLQAMPLILIPAVASQANPGHAANNSETVTLQATCPPIFSDTGSSLWYYDDADDNPCQGTIYLQCTHHSIEGSPWSTY